MINSILTQFSQLANVLIAIFVILGMANLNLIRDYIRKEHKNIFSVAWNFLKQPAWKFFSQYAEIGKDGTYVYSYDEHRQLHRKVRRFLGLAAGFTVVKILLIILGSLIFGSYLIIK